ncbi:unnamed protein product [Didymodactylos carnosus]|uniref:Uncharacterized protein n=1 Tax=Didymodactylos carnosus TaxID=1234261 RepID=A0A815TS67_9BILA|nr:unnamed protein product [Didymodactylos carnosus]CAF1538702.1 unnamed protein product [Didymodactylos carnosus]CAF4326791.1 unnamed protein product [Didymodactylos carnosus]CAF4370489.1 unnamed protein product [Didymodactylos carnosus]
MCGVRDIVVKFIYFVFSQSNEYYLIDWMSSAVTGEKCQYSGTISNASKFVLTGLVNAENPDENLVLIKCSYIDDIMSLVKCFLLDQCDEMNKRTLAAYVNEFYISRVIQWWDNYLVQHYSRIADIFKKLEDFREDIKPDDLYKFLHSAKEYLFENVFK